MLLLRGLTLGLLVAIVLLQQVEVRGLREVNDGLVADARYRIEHGAAATADPGLAVVRISRSRAGDDPWAALGLGHSADLVAIDGEPAAPWLDRSLPLPADGERAALEARWSEVRAGDYLELTVRGRPPMIVLVTP